MNWSANWSFVLIEITSILSDFDLDQKKCYCRAIGLVRVDIFDIVETLVQYFLSSYTFDLGISSRIDDLE